MRFPIVLLLCALVAAQPRPAAAQEAADSPEEVQAAGEIESENKNTDRAEEGAAKEAEPDDAEEAEEESAESEKPPRQKSDDGNSYGPAHGKGIALPGNIRLNGKFDVAYERYGYTGNLKEGNNAIRNYHRFVFLTREAQGDPFVFTADIIDRTFYEAGARFQYKDIPLRWTLRGGKILVPFGAEPDFHHSYGGLTGFDQPVLPIIWAQHGLAAQLRYRIGEFTLSNSAFMVQGYALGATNAVLNLQSDFSNDSKARAGFGDRVGLSWGPFNAWYSAYFNTLGFDRRLFMQAVDLELYRPTELPVLRDFALRAGMLRADVSGGEPGIGGANFDYYHFASYVDLRYYAARWLMLQARTGLRSFDNREGLYIDENRLTSSDASAHNVGVVFRYRGFTTSITHFWNLEKVNEVANDFLRVRLGYDF